jgi:hypothetical protein
MSIKGLGYAVVEAAYSSPPPAPPESEPRDIKKSLCQWSVIDDKKFAGCGVVIPSLSPGLYEVKTSQQVGVYFNKLEYSTEKLIHFPDSICDTIIDQIKKFWDREEIYKRYNLTFKRGILLHSAPGNGKSSIIRLIIKDIIERNGICINMSSPTVFIEGYRMFKEIQPNTPVVVIMEDIDSLIEHYDESYIINILDGVEKMDKVVFLATTNYPEKITQRIGNRPSRFDRRFEVGPLNDECRKMYFEHLFKEEDIKNFNIDIAKWVEDTDTLSVAHLKELFISVVILEMDYEETLETLKNMKGESILDTGSTGFDLGLNK